MSSISAGRAALRAPERVGWLAALGADPEVVREPARADNVPAICALVLLPETAGRDR